MSFQVTKKALADAEKAERRRIMRSFFEANLLNVIGITLLGLALYGCTIGFSAGMDRQAKYERVNQEILAMRGSL